MSITKIRSMFEQKGCQVGLYVVGAFVAIGLLYSGTCSSMMPWAQPQAQTANVGLVAELDGKQIGSDDVLRIADEIRKGRPTNGDPRQEFRLTVDALNQALTLIAIDSLAKAKGIVADEKSVTAFVEQDFRERAARLKMSYVATKKIKAEATDAEFEAAFKKDPQSGGQSFAEIKAASVKQALELMSDPTQGQVLKAQVVAASLSKAFASTIEATPEVYKKANESFELKALPLDDTKVPLEERKAAADKALADLKAGMKFPDAIKKYAKMKPDISIPYPRSLIEASPELAPILALKPGQMTGVIDYLGSPTIFILDSVKSNVPPDFDKKQKFYLDSYKAAQADKLLGKQLDEVRKGVKWHSDVCQLSFELGEVETKGTAGGLAKFHESLKEISAKLAKVQPNDLLGAKLLPMAKYEAFETLFLSSQPEAQKELRAERSELIREVLSDTESVVLRLELYDNEVQNGDFEAAGEALVGAAQNNTGTDPAAVDYNQRITAKLKEAEAAKKIDSAVLDRVRKEIDTFKQGVIQAEKDKVEAEKNASKVDDELKKLDDGGQSKAGQPKAPTDTAKGAGK